jgi:hypothetical protein
MNASYPPVQGDFFEVGSSGPMVILVYSSISGTRQWRRLMDDRPEGSVPCPCG